MNTGLRQVGEYAPSRRHTISAIKNPMDKSTIVSIFPKEIDEVKYTIEPGRFHINPGTYESPSLLVVGSSSWWMDTDIDRPLQEIPVSSVAIANSVINDYCNGLLGCNMGDSMPGLFFIPGEISLSKIKVEYGIRLAEAKIHQDNWYKILVRLADSLWARANGNPLVISDEMRLAARSLNFNDKVWLKDYVTAEMIKCFACGSLKDPNYPVCPSCRAVDMKHPTAKDLKFAV